MVFTLSLLKYDLQPTLHKNWNSNNEAIFYLIKVYTYLTLLTFKQSQWDKYLLFILFTRELLSSSLLLLLLHFMCTGIPHPTSLIGSRGHDLGQKTT